ncbi:MAG: 3-dehydroquinate dehydratase [SAR116 cluster bacterium]|nr:MAG: 3-dehydroquinate dehydratase [SAR116 cluster bacterium]
MIFGPNLNMLGTREPQIYGSDTMVDIMSSLETQASRLGLNISMMQSNDEGELVIAIQKACITARAILFNLAAYTHTSVVLRDAVAMFDGPRVEVHMSNNYQRESFRQISLTAPVSSGAIIGFGVDSFLLGLDAVDRLLDGNGGKDQKS